MPDRGEVHLGDDGIPRCWWCAGDSLLRAYHDAEWGLPVSGDDRHFERLALEGFQCGLSWLTILRKRPRFRKAFHDFDIARVARMSERDVERLAADAGIIRHRGKISATIHNARDALRIIDERGSLAAYLWSFAPREAPPPPRRPDDIPVKTGESENLSKALKRRGWRHVGPTTMYAMMQAIGMVNDHVAGCARRSVVETSHNSRDGAG